MNTIYRVTYGKRARKSLKKMDRFEAKMILSWIEKNLVDTIDPRRMGKPLVSNEPNKWRYRVGNYRLICNIEDGQLLILILEVGHRKDIYKSL